MRFRLLMSVVVVALMGGVSGVGAQSGIGSSIKAPDAENWTLPESLTPLSADEHWDPVIAVSGDGQIQTVAFATYSESQDSDFVEARVSHDGGASWSEPVVLSNVDNDASDPAIAMSADGQVQTVLWESYDSMTGDEVVWVSTSADAGVTWSEPEALSNVAIDAYDPAIAMSADGQVQTVVWESYDSMTGDEVVWVSTSADAGVTWSEPEALSNVAIDAYDPAIAMSADGQMQTVVWEDDADGADWCEELQMSTSTDAGVTWSEPVVLLEGFSCLNDPLVAMSADGQIQTVIVEQYLNNDALAVFRSADGGVTWSEPQYVGRLFHDVECCETTLLVSDDGLTQFIVAEMEDEHSDEHVDVWHSTDGGVSWSMPERVSYIHDDSPDPAMAMSADGSEVAVVWDFSEYIRYSRYVESGPTGPTGPPEIVDGVVSIDGVCDAAWWHLFTDVSDMAYYEASVACLYNLRITTGTSGTTYSPNELVTRGEIAAFLTRTYQTATGMSCSGPHPFTDVTDDRYYYNDVGCLYSLGVTTGTGASTYSPDEPVTRAQMAALLARMHDAITGDTCSGAHSFTDVDAGAYYADAVGCLVTAGISKGTSSSTFSPDQIVPRGQAAAFLTRLYASTS